MISIVSRASTELLSKLIGFSAKDAGWFRLKPQTLKSSWLVGGFSQCTVLFSSANRLTSLSHSPLTLAPVLLKAC